ncbi:MAG: PilZ domain-containing protein [Acidobacteriota bacterium]
MKVLLFNLPRHLDALRAGLLARPPFAVEEVSRAGELLRRLESTQFGMVIMNLPGDGIDIEQILPVIRSRGIPSARCILMLLVPEAHLEARRPLLSRGVNALLSAAAQTDELEAAIARQIEVAPRVNARVMVRVKARVQLGQASFIFQTVNVSATGMFLACATTLPVDSFFSFELVLPGTSTPLVGEARVVRHAAHGRESSLGMGTSFTSLRHDGRQILQNFLDKALAASSR